MNDALAEYVIACIHNAQERPAPHQIHQYLLEPLDGIESRPRMHYRMLDNLGVAIDEGRAVDAYNIFNLIWWDMNESSAQRIFNLVNDMPADPDDDLSGFTALELSHTIIARFPTLT